MRSRLGDIALLLGIVFLLAGCDKPAANDGGDKRGGFYGGVSGGLSRP